MPRIYTAKEISITGTDWSQPEAHLYRLNLPHGDAWGTALIGFQTLPAQEGLALGTRLKLAFANDTLMIGHLTRVPRRVSEAEDTFFATVADLRWDMSRTKIGQYGIGPVLDPQGAFPEVGYRIVFNPDGQGNRSEEPQEPGEGEEEDPNLFSFKTGGGAAKWTLYQMLVFVLHWYYPDLAIDDDEISVQWGNKDFSVDLTFFSVASALTALARRAGESWAPRYVENQAFFAPLSATPSRSVILQLPEREAGAIAADSSSLTILDAEAEESIMDSVDVVEIHTNRILVEHVHSNYRASEDEPSPLLVGAEMDPQTGFVWKYTVDVTKYEEHKLGKGLPAGSKAKPWRRQNCTRLSEDGTTYLDAYDALIEQRITDPVLPELCCWINIDETETKYRVKGGITILPDEAMILIEPKVITNQGEIEFSGTEWLTRMRIWITVATYLEWPQVYRTNPSVWHVGEAYPIVAVIERTDIQPMARYKSLLPKLETTDETETVLVADTEDGEWYVNINDDCEALHQAYYEARSRKEVTLTARLLDVVVIGLGAAVTVEPSTDLALTGKEVILDLTYDFIRGDYLTIRATNNLARLLSGDL